MAGIWQKDARFARNISDYAFIWPAIAFDLLTIAGKSAIDKASFATLSVQYSFFSFFDDGLSYFSY